MKKLLIGVLAIAFAALVFGAIVYNSESGQDALFKRAITSAMAPADSSGSFAGSLDGMRVVVCGSASPLGNDPNRAQACIAVVTPRHLFLFDVGAGSAARANQAQLPMPRINGVFLTHFHSDHIADLPAVNLNTWVRGRADRLQVYGPTGVQSVVDGFNAAYRLDRGYRTAHHGSELLAPERGPMQANAFAPGDVVWQDDTLKITSFSVEHNPIEPAVGYRVDYRGRSVVISGDTNASESLFKAAKDADLLFHDALSRTLLDPMIEGAREANLPVTPQIMTDVIDYHADASTLPEAAAAAGVKQLVLYHLVPVPPIALAEKMFLRGLPDSVLLANDLDTFDLPAGSADILIHKP